MLVEFLDYQRVALGLKCGGLGAEELRAKLGPSAMTLGALLKHLARAEDHWFGTWLRGLPTSAPWDVVEADWEWDWLTAGDDSPEYLQRLWEDNVVRSRVLVAEALTTGGVDQLSRPPWPADDPPSLRWILVHMIREYARHNGHADLIRESIDGLTGV